MLRNVYDFDNTIFDGDSTLKFYLFLLKKYPKLLFHLIKTIKYFFFKKTKKISLDEFKEKFYSFLILIKDVDKEIELFWIKNNKYIKNWYLNQKEETDIIISASPQWLLEPICRELNVKLIASKVDKYNGKLLDKNCKGKEKVTQFKRYFPNDEINNFYSDSLSDKYLANISKHAYLVNKNNIKNWYN